MTYFPRLLVATEFAPNSAGGGGSVIRQMLKDWPSEKLFWWSCFPDRDALFGQKIAAHRVALIPRKLYPSRRWRAQKSWLLENIWLPWATRHFKKTLELFKPEVIWVIPHFWAIPPLARALPGAGIGFHVSVYDYMDIRGVSDRIGMDRCRWLAELADCLYRRAVTRDAICSPMLEDLRVRTGCEGSINRAGLEQEDFDYLSHELETKSGSIRIVYAGTIIAEMEFELFVRALAELRPRFSKPLELHFYGDHSYRQRNWFNPGWMREHGNLPSAELSKALKECDWGFSPMKLTDDDPRYNRFSLPTKFVSYLAAGLPILTLGHPESTVVKMASQYQVGPCMTDNNLEKIIARLLAALSESNSKIKYRPEIRRCALAEFDARQMRAILYENFRKCASASVKKS